MRSTTRQLGRLSVVLAAVALVWAMAPHRSAAILGTLGLALPAVVWLGTGQAPGRRPVVSGLVVILGALLLRPDSGGIPRAELATVAGMALTASIAGRAVDRRAPARSIGAADRGRWVSIVVESDGPAGLAGLTPRPRFSPDPAPEGRSVLRLAAQGRHRQARRDEAESRRG